MYIHFKKIFQVENIPEKFKHREWSQTHHHVMRAGSTKNASTEGIKKKKKELRAWGFDVYKIEVIRADLTT